MAKMKQLAVQIEERKDEIENLIKTAEDAANLMFSATILSPELTNGAKRKFFLNFSNDRNLIELAITYLNLQKKD